MEKKRVLVTSALPYVNNQPHLGNLIGSLLSADVYARFGRLMDWDLVFVAGTDEYGTATEMEATKQKCTPLDIVEKNRVLHKKVYDFFGLSFDYFGHTHCEEHKNLVQEIFLKTIDYFDEREVKMMFCLTCEQYLADRYIVGECECGATSHGDQCDGCGKCYSDIQQLKNLRCAICSNEPEMRSTSHLYLDLKQLKKFIEKLDLTRWSENAKSIYKQWIKKEIVPRCMTRKLKHSWGVPVPLKGFEDKVFYVWYDAPIGYLTFLKTAIKGEDPFKWLQNSDWVQFMGKDNVPFHSITFPSVLYALKENQLKKKEDSTHKELIEKIESLSLTESKKSLIGDINASCIHSSDYSVDLDYNIVISATEYLTFNKTKFSKSKRIGIFGMDLVDKNIGDVTKWKFYLLRKRPENKDSDFNVEEFIELVTTELIANLGNFINRTLKFIEKRKVSPNELIKNVITNLNNPSSENNCHTEFVKQIDVLYAEYIAEMEKTHLKNGIQKILEMSSVGNGYLQGFQKDKEQLSVGFSMAFALVQLLGVCFGPFMSEAAAKLREIIALPEKFPKNFKEIVEKSNKDIKSTVEVLFTRFTEEEEASLREFIPK